MPWGFPFRALHYAAAGQIGLVAKDIGQCTEYPAGYQPRRRRGPGYGAALLAMVACGRFSNVQQAAQTLVRVKATVLPQPGLAEKYEQRYAQFRQIYPACRALFPKLQA